MEAEILFLCSPHPPTCSYPESDGSSTQLAALSSVLILSSRSSFFDKDGDFKWICDNILLQCPAGNGGFLTRYRDVGHESL